MSLGADIAAALPELRAQAESMHTDTFSVFRADGTFSTDPVTLEERPNFATVHGSVAGKLQFPNVRPQDALIPGQVVIRSEFAWHTSVNTLGVLPGDEVECIAVGPLGDPELVGVRVRVAGPFLKSHATARRFPVEELS